MITQCILQCRIPAFGLQTVHFLFLLSSSSPMLGWQVWHHPTLWGWFDPPILFEYDSSLELRPAKRRTKFADNPDGRLDPGCDSAAIPGSAFIVQWQQMLVDRADRISRLLLQTRSCELQNWIKLYVEGTYEFTTQTIPKSSNPVSYLFLGVWPIRNFQPCFSVDMDCFHAPWLFLPVFTIHSFIP